MSATPTQPEPQPSLHARTGLPLFRGPSPPPTPPITAAVSDASRQASCSLEDGCITCGDVAVPLTVVEGRGADALCRDDQGRTELVAMELVGRIAEGDVVLVHAGVALEHLDGASRHERRTTTEE